MSRAGSCGDWLEAQDQTFKRRGGGTPVFFAGVPGLLSAGERAGSCGCGCVYNGEPQASRAGRTQEHPGVPVPDGVARGSWPKERAPRAVPRRDCSPPASSKPVNGRSR